MSDEERGSPLARAALERYGGRLDAEQRARLVELARDVEAALADLRTFELANADPPDPPFAAGRDRDG